MQREKVVMNTGQDRGVKGMWRTILYEGIVNLLPLPPARAFLGLLPGKEGEEIQEAIKYGFKVQNMIAINRKVGEVAHLRQKFPELRCTHGQDFGKLPEKLRDTALDVLSLDLCSWAGAALEKKLETLAASAIFRDPFVLGVNFLRGREQTKRDISWTERLGDREVPESFQKIGMSSATISFWMTIDYDRIWEDIILAPFRVKGWKPESLPLPWPKMDHGTNDHMVWYKSPCGQTFMTILYLMRRGD